MRWGYGCGSFRAGVRVHFGIFTPYFAPLFGRRERGSQRSLSPGTCWYTCGRERRNAFSVGSRFRAGSARGMQRFLTGPGGTMSDYRTAAGVPGNPAGASGRGVGARRQRLSQAGEEVNGSGPAVLPGSKVANCQAGMFLAYSVSPLPSGLVDKTAVSARELDLVGRKTGVRRRVCRRLRQGYRSKTELALEMVGRAPWSGATCRLDGLRRTTPSGCRRSFREGLAALGMWYVLDVPSGFTTWPRSLPGPVPEYRDSGVPANPGCEPVSPDHGAAQRSAGGCSGVRLRWPEGSQGPRSYLFSAQSGCDRPQAQARRNPLGRLPPEPGRQRTPLLPVQLLLPHTPLETLAYVGGFSWRLKRSSRPEKRRGAGRVPRPAPGLAGITTWPCAMLGGAFLLSLTGLGGKRCPGSRGRRSTGWCGKCCPGLRAPSSAVA